MWLRPVGIQIDRAATAIGHIIDHRAVGVRTGVQGQIVAIIIKLERTAIAIQVQDAICRVKIIDAHQAMNYNISSRRNATGRHSEGQSKFATAAFIIREVILTSCR